MLLDKEKEQTKMQCSIYINQQSSDPLPEQAFAHFSIMFTSAQRNNPLLECHPGPFSWEEECSPVHPPFYFSLLTRLAAKARPKHEAWLGSAGVSFESSEQREQPQLAL